MPLTVSEPRRISSVLMNEGANVPEPLFLESERLWRKWPVPENMTDAAGAEGAVEAVEWFLACDVGVDTPDSGEGEEKTADFGRPLLGPGEVLAKGLFRGCAIVSGIVADVIFSVECGP
ncbi:hypothetical protein CTA1_1353 [Colletotrichum tanaceti]|uniref:Uncharacterized protein n=1 Tax=Colletotrichum tanaceti TaxID=1306861 RepID=A0A4U6X5D6_9PEZI|nr:hypothetical protein CTA1_1353 [Colletotrichum tanaceti]